MEIEIESAAESEDKQENDRDFIEITRIHCDKLSYNQFFHWYMSKNLPVVIKGIKLKTETSDGWFVDGKLHLERLQEVLKNHEVPVANCSKQYFDSHEKFQMKFGDFVNYWNGDRSAGQLYLKDFHLKQEFPGLDFYNVPRYFASDWLNEFLIDSNVDDYRFIYIGSKGTWWVTIINYRPMINIKCRFRTPFHSDVFGSYSWSANIYGRKQWFMLPPNEEKKLKDCLGNLPFSITRELLEEKNVKYFDLVQECDETLFVPSRWFHQVRNISDTVSVNHNWFNGCNIESIADSLTSHLKDVEKEISDCKDMENYHEHCQLMLKSSFGMNFHDFLKILTHVLQKRIKENSSIVLFDNFMLGQKHAISDIKTLLQLFERLLVCDEILRFEDIVDLLRRNIDSIKDKLL